MKPTVQTWAPRESSSLSIMVQCPPHKSWNFSHGILAEGYDSPPNGVMITSMPVLCPCRLPLGTDQLPIRGTCCCCSCQQTERCRQVPCRRLNPLRSSFSMAASGMTAMPDHLPGQPGGCHPSLMNFGKQHRPTAQQRRPFPSGRPCLAWHV